MPIRNTPKDVWRFVAKRGANECWEWQGYRFAKGYGRIAIGRKMYAAHRVVYFLEFGGIELSAPRDPAIPEFVLHKCDNTFCCNPKHLFLGSYGDNAADRCEKGRSADVSGAKNPRAKLANDAVDIRWIFSLGAPRSAIAREYGVSWASIDKIVSGERYA